MNELRPFLIRMSAFLVIVVAICAGLFATLLEAFLANPALNGVILGVLVIGIVFIYRQVLRLAPEAAWLAAARTNVPGQSVQRAPRLLAPLATMIAERRGRVSLNAVSMRSVLDGIGSRLDESHELARYLIGLLIFLGLLGTFWGLLQTVSSVGDVIGGLSVGGEDLGSAFDDLKGGLEAPLAGMGTAFSSSLFGLAGSLVLGFLELQASQAQNRFYNDLEDWLSSHTRLTGGTLSVEGGDQSVPAYVSALLERTADSLDDLQRTLARGEDNRASSSANLLSLTERLATLTDQMRAEQDLMVKLVENQMEMRPVLERLAESGRQPVTLDEASRAHLRNLDVYVNRLLEEMVAGREQSVNELRSEFKLLARTIAAVAENERRDGRK
ncbi:MAG: flagellar motor protein MotA [Rhodospirillaceae bacterium]|nr:flagellar motor protein MotA [Rhodospirillaceae bacterium]MBT5780323.1 flagellar motor protein MotA [Rhodospirillaceae bacterium]MBT6830772.1 flagellar motor protein MotA [Rhodospirillaceae bacterium]MBT7293200.1 flagellar motor protein MotA [Rhodospirillaceae bacterium]